MYRYRIGSYPFFLYFKPGTSAFQVGSYFDEDERNFSTMQRWMENNIRINDPENKEVVINKAHAKAAIEEVEEKVGDSSELVESFQGLLTAVKAQNEALTEVKRELHSLKSYIDKK